jgi:hypothetical protein
MGIHIGSGVTQKSKDFLHWLSEATLIPSFADICGIGSRNSTGDDQHTHQGASGDSPERNDTSNASKPGPCPSQRASSRALGSRV